MSVCLIKIHFLSYTHFIILLTLPNSPKPTFRGLLTKQIDI